MLVSPFCGVSPQKAGSFSTTSKRHADKFIDHSINYVQPAEIFRSERGPLLPDMDGPVIVKTSWQDASGRGNEAKMYRASSGRFGVIPHVCSYEGVGEHREAISNILFLPRQEDVTKYYWRIFGGDPPARLDLRTLWFTVLGAEGQSLVRAKCPRQLSRAWVHFHLGAPGATLSPILLLMRTPHRMVIDIPLRIHAPGY